MFDLIGILERLRFQVAGSISIYEGRLGGEDVLISPQKKALHADDLASARNCGFSLWMVECQHGWSFSIICHERFKRPLAVFFICSLADVLRPEHSSKTILGVHPPNDGLLAVSAAYLCLREVTNLRCRRGLWVPNSQFGHGPHFSLRLFHRGKTPHFVLFPQACIAIYLI